MARTEELEVITLFSDPSISTFFTSKIPTALNFTLTASKLHTVNMSVSNNI